MRLTKNNLLATLGLLGLAMMVAQSYFGDNGLAARSSLQSRISGLNKQLEILRHKRQQLEHQARLMSPQHVDRDLLEEMARRQLNFVYENERILVRKE